MTINNLADHELPANKTAKIELAIEGMSREQADVLLGYIHDYVVNDLGLEMAGGVTWEDEDGEEESSTVS